LPAGIGEGMTVILFDAGIEGPDIIFFQCASGPYLVAVMADQQLPRPQPYVGLDGTEAGIIRQPEGMRCS